MRLGHDPRPREWRRRFQCHELDMASEAGFEQLGKRQEVRVGLGARVELDQQVNIAAGTCLIPHDRTEQGEPFDPRRLDFRFRFDQAGRIKPS
jgi:hypothetical protein